MLQSSPPVQPSPALPRSPAGAPSLWLRRLAPALLTFTFFGFFATAVWDVDFFWHAASGRWIVESRSLPEKDPFGLYEAVDLRSAVVLHYSWASQVILFATLETFGPGGIIFLKAAILALGLWILYRRALLAGAPWSAAVVVTSLAGLTLLLFTGERPQLFSFLMTALLFQLLDGWRHGASYRHLALVPLVTLLWANLHGGVALGGVLLLAALAGLAGEGWCGRAPRGFPWPAAAVLLLSALLTLASPAGTDTYRALLELQGSDIQQRSTEYLSPFVLTARHGLALPWFWVLAGLLLPWALVRAAVRRRIFELVILALLGGLALTSFRYIPFFLFAAGPYLAGSLADWPPLRHRAIALGLAGAVALGAPLALVAGTLGGRAFQSGLQPGRFPEQAVALLRHAGAEGRAFNHLNWGGFLHWHLYPEVRAFIDGRTFFFVTGRDGKPSPDRHVFEKYTHILWVTEWGKKFLRDEDFDFVLVPDANPFTGEKYPLDSYLAASTEWQPLYRRDGVFLYQRRRASKSGAVSAILSF